MADLPNLLLASLDPSTRKQAEQNLNPYSEQQGFLSHLLGLNVQPIAEQDKAALRSGLVPAMLALSSPTDKAIRAQIAEAVSLIAELDFPHPWADLIDQLVAYLSPTDYSINIGVLETVHSIFRHWRALVRTDTLYNEINLVFEKFLGPFLQLFRQTAALLTQPQPGRTKEQYALLAQCMVLLIDIYYDFTCHDLPPAIEDSYMEFFGANGGDVDDTTPSLLSQIKTRIFQVVELFIKLFAETLQISNVTETFIQLVCIADDILVSQSLRFISTAVRSRFYKEIFSAPSIISTLIEGVVMPNAMLHLASAVSDTATRRQAAADVLQALVSSGYEAETTQLVGEWFSKGLAKYEANKKMNWKSKDGAMYLLTAVAMRGVTTQQGVTSTNALVDVVKFFSDHVYQDLQAGSGSVHPILQVDAIRFLYTFRMQLTKAQLLSVLPNLITHLDSANYVTFRFNLSSDYPSRYHARNYPVRQSLTPGYEQILNRLVAILGVISKNPSNPKFDQYIFESLSALMRFVTAGSPDTIPTFEGVLFAPFTCIIQQDIDQYLPYVFQILAQMLELHPSNVQSVLAVIQQRLVPSKINDVHGFELLQAVVMYVKP
ncbi:Cse1-domain-containing protein [Gymnopus androsaceus JB14]|uniref:Cse1-domain-containing protein n=1 Tax=Gymnopus androsaceus JB14 TaxID=1447944 RepID=A0A6A4GXF9_9AGAR|nr:Cse1-domain-containing protein [Gymnopus androsaceus JB14]